MTVREHLQAQIDRLDQIPVDRLTAEDRKFMDNAAQELEGSSPMLDVDMFAARAFFSGGR